MLKRLFPCVAQAAAAGGRCRLDREEMGNYDGYHGNFKQGFSHYDLPASNLDHHAILLFCLSHRALLLGCKVMFFIFLSTRMYSSSWLAERNLNAKCVNFSLSLVLKLGNQPSKSVKKFGTKNINTVKNTFLGSQQEEFITSYVITYIYI